MSKIADEIRQFVKESRAFTKWKETTPGDPESPCVYYLECDGVSHNVEVFVHGFLGGTQVEINGLALSSKSEHILQDILNALHPRRIPRKKS